MQHFKNEVVVLLLRINNRTFRILSNATSLRWPLLCVMSMEHTAHNKNYSRHKTTVKTVYLCKSISLSPHQTKSHHWTILDSRPIIRRKSTHSISLQQTQLHHYKISDSLPIIRRQSTPSQ